MFQKIPFYRQLADLGMEILDPTGVRLRVRMLASTLEDVRRPFEQRFLPLMNHCRVTTCAKGEMSVRIYDGGGEKRKFLAVDTAYIERHVFRSIVTGIEGKPAKLTIKYTIDAE